MNSLFLDANYVVALEVSDDQHHQQAVQHWKTIMESPVGLVTTSYVLDEVVTFLNRRRQHAKALKIGNNLLTASNIKLIHVDQELFYEGWEFFEQHSDKTFSLTDCISFVLMNKLEIAKALTFDKHFTQAGFVKLP